MDNHGPALNARNLVNIGERVATPRAAACKRCMAAIPDVGLHQAQAGRERRVEHHGRTLHAGRKVHRGRGA